MCIFLHHIKTFRFAIAWEIFIRWWWWCWRWKCGWCGWRWLCGGTIILGGFLFLLGRCIVCWWFFLQQLQIQVIIDAIQVECAGRIAATILFAGECFVKCFIVVIPWIRPRWYIFNINQIVYIIRMSKVWWFTASTFAFGEHFFQYRQIPMINMTRLAVWFEAHRRDLLFAIR